MVYHSSGDRRLNTITFPFDDGTYPTYYIPVTTDDLLDESDFGANTLTDALNNIKTGMTAITNAQIDALFA